jgi:hypothetical protein
LTLPLQAGATCFIALQATVAAGPRTGGLTVASTAANSPQSIDLLANGVLSVPTATVASLASPLEVGGAGMSINPAIEGSPATSAVSAFYSIWAADGGNEERDRSEERRSNGHKGLRAEVTRAEHLNLRGAARGRRLEARPLESEKDESRNSQR